MKRNFLELCENTLTRYQRAGFLVGDYIKFADKYQNISCYADLSDTMRARIDDIFNVSKEMNLRVVSIKNKYPSDQPGNDVNSNGSVALDIAIDYGGGRYYSLTTIPSSIVEVLDYGINLAPLPGALKRDNLVTLKPEKLEPDKESETFKQTRMASSGKGDAITDTELGEDNIKIPAKGTASYVKYMP